MLGKRAKILSMADVGDLLAFASCTRHPLRNAVMVLLSAKAGLRAGEIANLTWDMVVDANGHISGLIELTDNAAKKCQNSQGSAINYAIRLIHAVCGLAGSPTLMDEIRADLRNFGTFRVACLTTR
jgi:integrase